MENANNVFTRGFNMAFNKHFVYHNLDKMSKDLDTQPITDASLDPLLVTLNRVQFDKMETTDAKRLLDSLDFKISSDQFDRIPTSKIDHAVKSIYESNQGFMDALVNQAEKMNKPDSFAVQWAESVNARFEAKLLNEETISLGEREPEAPTARRPSMSR